MPQAGSTIGSAVPSAAILALVILAMDILAMLILTADIDVPAVLLPAVGVAEAIAIPVIVDWGLASDAFLGDAFAGIFAPAVIFMAGVIAGFAGAMALCGAGARILLSESIMKLPAVTMRSRWCGGSTTG